MSIRLPGIGATFVIFAAFFLCIIVAYAVARDQTDDEVALALNSPLNVSEIVVDWPHEVSGVASVPGGYLVVGDDDAKYYYKWPGGTEHRVWSDDKHRVCDGESIDVGFGPDNRQINLLLGEDFRKVYIQGAPPIELPESFREQCKRGAEGLSVRWSNGGWDLVVLWEGGVPERKHAPNDLKSKKCKRVERVRCPMDHKAYDALVAFYRLSDDLQQAELQKIVTLKTSTLLEKIDPGEAFRATDIAWYRGQLLVLLGSTPLDRQSDDPYRHTWIQGFDLDGKAIRARQLRLENVWKDYRAGKNWEGMDTTLDGQRLVLGYDRKGPSELVVFDPGFK